MLVPCTGGRTRIFTIADHTFEWRVWRIAGEIFIGININIGGMIDGQQLDLIEINRFFERLHEAEAQLAIFFLNRASVDFDRLRWTGDVALYLAVLSRDPVADDARAEHVADELIFFTIPCEERRA